MGMTFHRFITVLGMAVVLLQAAGQVRVVANNADNQLVKQR